MTHNSTNARGRTRDVNAGFRALQAVKLRVQEKLTYDEIAQRCGYASRGACHDAVQRELNRVIVQDIDELRQEEHALLNALQATIYPYVLVDDEEDEDSEGKPKKQAKKKLNLFAVDRLLAIQKSRRDLLGLDVKPEESAGSLVVIREVPAGYLGLPEETPKV